ncbi:ATP synthase subunit d, mitochondrial-like [Lytechinus pictus]|uniref:ATP synthase subunit d, mitochondrial-like n=1 Tax=Lytechinus pictus TaxID=7653 RepID=UPI00240D196B|nr:ATP synthase subunit d, mitochondrial-like [Lytechinus pictus]
MASRRLGKSVVDWAAFVERVPPNQKGQFNSLKGKFDALNARLSQMPEQAAVPKWDAYRKSVPVAGLVDKFEKEFSALKVPYPADTVSDNINTQEKEMDVMAAEFVKASNERIAKYTQEVNKLESMTAFEELTVEEFDEMFPEGKKMKEKYPWWPHVNLAEL